MPRRPCGSTTAIPPKAGQARRQGWQHTGQAAQHYNYTYDGLDRLQTITGGTGTYGYDLNGNMERDARTGRTVEYNELGLPKSMSGGITYGYDATGRKLRSVIGGVATDYIDGIEWEGSTLNVIHMEEGHILPSGVYEYTLKDHLGNTRSGFASNATGTVKFRNDYYPFGLSHTGGMTSSPKPSRWDSPVAIKTYKNNGKPLSLQR